MAPAADPKPVTDLCPACRQKMLDLLDWMDREDLRRFSGEAMTTTPEDTLHDAGISTKSQARYQRRMSKLLARRA